MLLLKFKQSARTVCHFSQKMCRLGLLDFVEVTVVTSLYRVTVGRLLQSLFHLTFVVK